MINILVKDKQLYIKSEYIQKVVEFMRSRPKRFWDKVNRQWVIPESDLEILLKTIVDYGFEYNLSYDARIEQSTVSDIPDWYEFKTEPFQHQIEGIKYGLEHPKFLLADEQGLGKTKCMLDLSSILKKEKGIKHVLIVTCVNGLKYNWESEVYKHTNESAYVLGTRYKKNGNKYIGSNEDRLKDIQSIANNEAIDNCYYIITNIETL